MNQSKDNNQDNTKKFESIDVSSLQQSEIKKSPSNSLKSPPTPSTPSESNAPPAPPTYAGSSTAPSGSSSLKQEQEQYILSVKKIIYNFLAAFQEGTITFTEKSKQKQKIQRVFILNKKKVDLEVTENGTSTNYVYHINTGQYLEDNMEKDFFASQDFVQSVLQPTFKWIADDKAVYTLKRTQHI